MTRLLYSLVAICGLVACAEAESPTHSFVTQEITRFDEEPWAMAFLPDGRVLVTTQPGTLLLVTQDGQVSAPLNGVPEVSFAGQGGLGDVALHPDFEDNRLVYLSYAEAGDDGTRGAAIARGRLSDDASALVDVEVIWRQLKIEGNGHYGHRMVFSPDGYLFVSSGDRKKFDPAQDLDSNLGKMLRLNDDGTAAAGNPFESRGGVSAEIWSYGHRNPLGHDFDSDGRLWSTEMGPRGGDELNLVVKGENYGYPLVSNGRHYNFVNIPDHDTRPDLAAPALWWTPVIAPGGFIIYEGDEFPAWKGNGFAAGLKSEALVRIEFEGESAVEAERFDMGERMRAVVEGPNGAIWMLAEDGALLKLTAQQGGGKDVGWRTPDADNLMIMTLPQGEVVIELAPEFAPKSVENIRKLVKDRYFDGLAIMRSHDNYVAQWGDPNFDNENAKSIGDAAETIEAEFLRSKDGLEIAPVDSRDAYADGVGFVDGFPVAWDDENAWMTHCYGMLGVARGMTTDSGNGTGLYVVTGHAPRHLDKNITLAGRVLSGIEHLSSLPRGTGPLGFYESPEEYTTILEIRMASEDDVSPAIDVMDTNSTAFEDYVAGRTTRTNEWFVDPTGRIELCNLHPPVRSAEK